MKPACLRRLIATTPRRPVPRRPLGRPFPIYWRPVDPAPTVLTPQPAAASNAQRPPLNEARVPGWERLWNLDGGGQSAMRGEVADPATTADDAMIDRIVASRPRSVAAALKEYYTEIAARHRIRDDLVDGPGLARAVERMIRRVGQRGDDGVRMAVLLFREYLKTLASGDVDTVAELVDAPVVAFVEIASAAKDFKTAAQAASAAEEFEVFLPYSPLLRALASSSPTDAAEHLNTLPANLPIPTSILNALLNQTLADQSLSHLSSSIYTRILSQNSHTPPPSTIRDVLLHNARTMGDVRRIWDDCGGWGVSGADDVQTGVLEVVRRLESAQGPAAVRAR
ncbi:hypothetical protein HK101_001597, partial [Irineochytrium annulatum]